MSIDVGTDLVNGKRVSYVTTNMRRTPNSLSDSPRIFRALSVLGLATVLLIATTGTSSAGTAKSGQTCKKVGTKSGTLVCTKKGSRLVWARATPTTTKGAAGTTVAGGSATTTPADANSIDGTWKATSASQVGYRVKEVLNGQDVEAVGRTNAVTGTMVIAGTKATSVDLTVDVTKLESDSGRRDDQVQGRILETAKFPTAKLKISTPIDFGKVPADREVLTLTAKVSLTIKSTTKTIDVSMQARRNGAAVEINGQVPIIWSEWGIENPSLAPFVTTEDRGLLEYLIVFGR